MRTAAAHLFAPPATALLLASAFLALSARAHGHSHGDNYDAHGAEESGMSYAERHVGPCIPPALPVVGVGRGLTGFPSAHASSSSPLEQMRSEHHMSVRLPSSVLSCLS